MFFPFQWISYTIDFGSSWKTEEFKGKNTGYLYSPKQSIERQEIERGTNKACHFLQISGQFCQQFYDPFLKIVYHLIRKLIFFFPFFFVGKFEFFKAPFVLQYFTLYKAFSIPFDCLESLIKYGQPNLIRLTVKLDSTFLKVVYVLKLINLLFRPFFF